MENCPKNTSVVTDNTPLECNEYTSDKCVLHENAISFFSLPANSPQYDINNAITNTFINQNNRINLLEAGGFGSAELTINGNYNIQSTDNKKYIYINSAINNPTISLNSALPDGFECYFVYMPATDEIDPEVIDINYNFTTSPYFTVPTMNQQLLYQFFPYGKIQVKKRNANFYFVTGDLGIETS